MAVKKKLSDAIDNLANMFDSGILLACTDPASLLDLATEEIKAHRKLKAAIDKEKGNNNEASQ